MSPLLLSADVERSVAFYRSLGFEERFALRRIGQSRYFCELAFGASSHPLVMLLDRTHWRFQADLQRQPLGAGVLIYVPVTDAAAYRDAIARALPAVEELQSLYYGREFVVEDPDGYRIAFFEAYPGGERLPNGVVSETYPCG